MRKLTVPQKHQKKIAIRTLQLNDVGMMILGGMNKPEARDFLRSIGLNPNRYEVKDVA